MPRPMMPRPCPTMPLPLHHAPPHDATPPPHPAPAPSCTAKPHPHCLACPLAGCPLPHVRLSYPFPGGALPPPAPLHLRVSVQSRSPSSPTSSSRCLQPDSFSSHHAVKARVTPRRARTPVVQGRGLYRFQMWEHSVPSPWENQILPGRTALCRLCFHGTAVPKLPGVSESPGGTC